VDFCSGSSGGGAIIGVKPPIMSSPNKTNSFMEINVNICNCNYIAATVIALIILSSSHCRTVFQAILVFSFIKYHPVEYGNQQYPLWADLIGWMMPLSTNLPILVVAVFVVYHSHGNTILEVTGQRLSVSGYCTSTNTSIFHSNVSLADLLRFASNTQTLYNCRYA